MSLADAAASLQARLVGEDVVFRGCATDSRSIGAGELFIALRGDRFDGHDFLSQASGRGAGAALVEREPARPELPLLLVDDSRTAMGLLAGYWRSRFELPLIAITGSNGKTTVKEMLAAILRTLAPVLYTSGNLNNDIGVPLTLFGLGRKHRYAVVEMGANHPGEIAGLARMARPTVAVVTQCAPAHLEGFGSVAGVARAKAEIFQGLDAGGTAVINADDEYAGLWRGLAGARRQLEFGIEQPARIRATQLRPGPGSTGFVLDTPAGTVDIGLPLPGLHNVRNALAAAACSMALDIPLASIRAGLESIRPVAGRLQVRTGRRHACIYDDSYNANPGSLAAALEVLQARPGRRWLVLGDMGELGAGAADWHRHAGELARSHGIERLYGLGPLSRQAVSGFGAGARAYASAEDLVTALEPELDRDVTVLVKGSRAMHLERVVAGLVAED